MIMNYFERISKEENLKGKIVFLRKVLKPQDIPDWKNSQKPLSVLIFREKGLIEDENDGSAYQS